jgi:Uncharacterized protein conserved in bacteria (DUF2252)
LTYINAVHCFDGFTFNSSHAPHPKTGVDSHETPQGHFQACGIKRQRCAYHIPGRPNGSGQSPSQYGPAGTARMMSERNDPLFLQFKEAAQSVLEPYAGKSAYNHHGQRVVMGQRLMQPASDIFLGWVTARNGRQFYVRQLRDAKIKPLVETFNAEALDLYAMLCGWVLARAHAKVSELSTTISGYLGSSSDEFDEAMGKFGLAYADQAERDYAALKAAVRKGKIDVYRET